MGRKIIKRFQEPTPPLVFVEMNRLLSEPKPKPFNPVNRLRHLFR